MLPQFFTSSSIFFVNWSKLVARDLFCSRTPAVYSLILDQSYFRGTWLAKYYESEATGAHVFSAGNLRTTDREPPEMPEFVTHDFKFCSMTTSELSAEWMAGSLIGRKKAESRRNRDAMRGLGEATLRGKVEHWRGLSVSRWNYRAAVRIQTCGLQTRGNIRGCVARAPI